MNNQLHSELNDPEQLPRGSASFVQATLQQRLQNRINDLLHSEPDVIAQMETRSRQAAALRLRVDAMSARVDHASRLTALLRHYLMTLRLCLDQFISADLRDVMRRLVSEINANRDCLHRLQQQQRP